jgi:hypothetical protein
LKRTIYAGNAAAAAAASRTETWDDSAESSSLSSGKNLVKLFTVIWLKFTLSFPEQGCEDKELNTKENGPSKRREFLQ